MNQLDSNLSTEVKQLINILYTSNVLHNLLPYVRKITLIETLYAISSIEQVNNIFLENLSTSRYIPQDHKDTLAELVFTKQWSSLRTLLKCSNNFEININRFRSFQDMVITIFSKSRKVSQIDDNRRIQLGRAILEQTTIDGLKQLAFNALETSEAFDENARNLIANDIIDNRYDLLLLPDRFDCEDVARLNSNHDVSNHQELEECPICLGTNEVDTKLPCNHLFCRSCIQSWCQQNTQYSECPLCRGRFTLEEMSSVNN